MKKRIELSEREKEIFFLLRSYFGFSKEVQAPTEEDVEDVLWTAWDASKEELHDLGIPKFKIGQMFSKLLGLKGMTRDLFLPNTKEIDFWYVPLSI